MTCAAAWIFAQLSRFESTQVVKQPELEVH